MAKHEMMDGRVHVYKRENSRYWQCSAFINGKNRRTSTKEDSLSLAKDFADDWYLELRGKHRRGEIYDGKTFAFAAKQFRREYETLTAGQRNERYVNDHWRRLDKRLVPFFGEKRLTEITSGLVQEYRIKRHDETMAEKKKPPSRTTMHQEMVTLRQVLKTATRHQWLAYLPDLSQPYRASTKISHRGWFEPAEYKALYEATRRRAKKPKRPRFKWDCEQLHDKVLFLANTGLRPDEAGRLQRRDVIIIHDEATRERILEISVRGKNGVGYCMSMPGAVLPFERLVKRNKYKPTDLLFPKSHSGLLTTILKELKMKRDREGNARTFYSLRHTYICMRLLDGAEIYQIAKNCRTSVEMIQKYYAAHLKNMLNTAAINVRRPKAKVKGSGKSKAKH